jgi:hypothetical protein
MLHLAFDISLLSLAVMVFLPSCVKHWRIESRLEEMGRKASC